MEKTNNLMKRETTRRKKTMTTTTTSTSNILMGRLKQRASNSTAGNKCWLRDSKQQKIIIY